MDFEWISALSIVTGYGVLVVHIFFIQSRIHRLEKRFNDHIPRILCLIDSLLEEIKKMKSAAKQGELIFFNREDES